MNSAYHPINFVFRISIDGRNIFSVDALHDLIESADFCPDYYGRNMDALYDVLCSVSETLCIELHNFDVLRAHIGEPANALLRVLHFSCDENENISLHFVI